MFIRRQLPFALLALAACSSLAFAAPVRKDAPKAEHRTPGPHAVIAKASQAPRIEAVFVLDTTGSMAGLIEGAKQKIWSIANQMASAQPAPELRVGLVAYRDRGDAYVVRRFPMTEDIDEVYARLQQLQAQGGGDGPESVNQALYEAVHDSGWSRDGGVYRVVFLVGDAPPHMDYDNDVHYPQTLQLARQRGIVVNALQAGNAPDARSAWQRIAQLGRGDFTPIAQDGAMVAIATPMDEELNELNRELSRTVMPYGEAKQKQKLRSKLERARAASSATGAARLSYLKKKGGRVAMGGGDLVDDLAQGRATLADLPESQLPDELKGLSRSEQAARVKRAQTRRARIQQKVDALLQARDAHVKRELERRAEAGERSFDAEVMRSIKSQAAAVGLSYE